MKFVKKLLERWRWRRWQKWARSMVGKTVIGTGRCCNHNVAGKRYRLVHFVEDLGDYWTNEHDAPPNADKPCRWLCTNGFEGGRRPPP